MHCSLIFLVCILACPSSGPSCSNVAWTSIPGRTLSLANWHASLRTYVWLTASSRASSRPDHLGLPFRHHVHTMRFINCVSASQRQGRGARQRARAFSRFRRDVSGEGIRGQFSGVPGVRINQESRAGRLELRAAAFGPDGNHWVRYGCCGQLPFERRGDQRPPSSQHAVPHAAFLSQRYS
jgi:hypothetical protein